MNLTLNVILMVLNVANIVLHTCGTYLLYLVNKTYAKTAQQIFLIHLSISETLMNLIECLRRILDFILVFGITSYAIVEVRHYLQIISLTGISFMFYMVMVYITFDRLMNILLNIYYPLYWSVTKTKYLLYGTWCISLFVCVIICIAHYLVGYNWRDGTFTYFYPTVDIIFICLAVATYTLIFRKYKQSVMRRRKNKISRKRSVCARTQSSSFERGRRLFQKSRFYIPVLLITSFILFTVASDLIYLFYGLVSGNESENLLIMCWISYAVSNLVDGIIYIFMHHHVNILFHKKRKLLSCFLKQCIRKNKLHSGNADENNNTVALTNIGARRKIAVVNTNI